MAVAGGLRIFLRQPKTVHVTPSRAQRLSILKRWNSTAQARVRICPKCSTPLPTALPTCTSCTYIQRLPSSTSYFDALGIKDEVNPFRVDVRDLRLRFLQAQRVCHPDAWSAKGEGAREIAESQSSILNTAYRTLLSPVLRAQYILTLNGHPPQETDKLEDNELIMEIMEAREELEEASSLTEIEDIRQRNSARIDECVSEVSRLIGEKKWAEAAQATVKLKYFEGIDIAAREREGGS